MFTSLEFIKSIIKNLVNSPTLLLSIKLTIKIGSSEIRPKGRRRFCVCVCSWCCLLIFLPSRQYKFSSSFSECSSQMCILRPFHILRQQGNDTTIIANYYHHHDDGIKYHTKVASNELLRSPSSRVFIHCEIYRV